MNLKIVLAQINRCSDKLRHGRPPSLWRSGDHVLALDAVQVGPSTPSLRAKRSNPEMSPWAELPIARSLLKASLIDPPVLPRPIRLPQLPPQDLARRIPRQCRQELHALRRLEPGDALAGEVDDVNGGRLLAGLHHHHGLHRLAPFVVGYADHGSFRDVGMIA